MNIVYHSHIEEPLYLSFLHYTLYWLFLLQTHRQHRVLLRAAEAELVPVQAVRVHTQRQAGGDEGNLRQGDNSACFFVCEADLYTLKLYVS